MFRHRSGQSRIDILKLRLERDEPEGLGMGFQRIGRKGAVEQRIDARRHRLQRAGSMLGCEESRHGGGFL